MQKYKKPKFSYRTLGINPCANSLIVPVVSLEYKKQYVKDDEGILLPLVEEVEATKFCKLFITAERRKLISNLSPSSKELYLWIMFEIEPGEDALWINRERFMEENTTSLNTYKKAVEELVRYAFLAYSTVKDVYWINPDFFFNGNRLTKYPTKIKLI